MTSDYFTCCVIELQRVYNDFLQLPAIDEARCMGWLPRTGDPRPD